MGIGRLGQPTRSDVDAVWERKGAYTEGRHRAEDEEVHLRANTRNNMQRAGSVP